MLFNYPKYKQKGLAPILIILLIAGVIGGYLIYQKQTKPVSMPQSSPSPIANNSISPDEHLLIKKAIFLLPRINISLDDKNASFIIDKYNGLYAAGTGGVVGSGFKWGTAKVNNQWVVVFAEQESPKCSDLDKYDFPDSMSPPCLGTSGGEIFRRPNPIY